MLSHKGTFSANTATGNQSVTGVGFQGKAILIWGVRRTATGYGSGGSFFYGAATSSSARWAFAVCSDDAAATSNNARQNSGTLCINILSDGTPTVDGQADFVSFDSDGFTINWTDAPTSAWIIHYLVLGGSDLSAAATRISVPAATGNQATTGIGFQSTAILTACIAAATSSTNANIAVGMATGTAERASVNYRDADAAATMDVASHQISTRAISIISGSSTSVLFAADHVSFDADGFTLNWATTAGALSNGVGILALGGVSAQAGVETQKTSTGTKATTGLGFHPDCLICASINLASSASVDTGSAKLSFGASDGSNEGHSWLQSADATADSDLDQRTEATKLIGFSTQPSTTLAECDVSSFDADGYTLDWTTADATAREFAYLALGPSTHFGASASTWTFTKAVAGFRTRFGASASTITFTKAVAGFKTTRGATASTYTFVKAVAGARTVFGATSITYSFTKAVAGFKTTRGATASTITFSKAVAGFKTTRGTVALTITFTKAVASFKTTTGASASTYTFSKAVAGVRTRFGTTATTITFGATTAGDGSGPPVHFGATASTITFSKAVAGSRTTFGAVNMPITFSALSSGDGPSVPRRRLSRIEIRRKGRRTA